MRQAQHAISQSPSEIENELLGNLWMCFNCCEVSDLILGAYGGRYDQSMAVLKHAKGVKGMVTKSSIMLGLGENDEEIKQTMLDLRAAGVDICTLGQYLQVMKTHLAASCDLGIVKGPM